MKDCFYIMDSVSQRFYAGTEEYLPWIVNAFTDESKYAIEYSKADLAKKDVERFERTKTEFDGNTPISKNRLVVVQRMFQVV